MSQVKTYHAYDNQVSELPLKASTLDEATLATGHGVYAVFRLYPGMKALYLSEHLARMRRSAQLLGGLYPLSDRWLKARLREAVFASGIAIPRIRLTVPHAAPDTAFISLEPFRPPSEEVLEEGVAVSVVAAHRDQPLAKDSRFVEQRAALKEAGGEAAYEVLLAAEDGALLEGMTSNFYAVIDNSLYTASEGVLEGIARKLVLDVAAGILPIILQPVRCVELPQLDEAFLSSSSRGPIPIVRIGDQLIGEGRPGRVFRMIREAYDQRVEMLLEEI